jgi:molybdopterin-guanine dinucleotide biosynthesis protein A
VARRAVANPPYTGVVLAGGKSQRMGRDKRVLEIDGMPLLAWVLAHLRPLVSDLIVATSDGAALPNIDARVVMDQFPGMGVLAGLHTGLIAAHYPWAFVVAGDMPLLNSDLLHAMTQELHPTIDVVVPRWHGLLEPLHALYRAPVCAQAAERALRSGQRRIVALYPEVRVREMPEAEVRHWDPDGDSFFNVNTPADWQTALERLKP